MSFSLVLLAFATYTEYRDNKSEKEMKSGARNSNDCSYKDNDSNDENKHDSLLGNSIWRQSGLHSSDRSDCHGTSHNHLERYEDRRSLSRSYGRRRDSYLNFISGTRRLLGYAAAEPAPAAYEIPVYYAATELTTLASRTLDCTVLHRERPIQPSVGFLSHPYKNNHIDYGAVGL